MAKTMVSHMLFDGPAPEILDRVVQGILVGMVNNVVVLEPTYTRIGNRTVVLHPNHMGKGNPTCNESYQRSPALKLKPEGIARVSSSLVDYANSGFRLFADFVTQGILVADTCHSHVIKIVPGKRGK